MKVGIIGAGQVGATLAMRVVESGIGDCVLLDVVEGLAQGKAIDIQDASSIVGHENLITGTTEYRQLSGSEVLVITAGMSRKPGMSRDDLVKKNYGIINSVTNGIKSVCEDPIIIVVTNPLDVMTYCVRKLGNFSKKKVMGMAGTLDSARLKNIIAEVLDVKRGEIETFVLGCHGDSMVPLISRTTIKGRPIRDIASAEELQRIIEKTRKRGAQIVRHLKTGSAYYSPSAGVIEILRAIRDDSNKILPVSAFLDGEYGIKGIYLGVTAKINRGGIGEIIDIGLEKDELADFRASSLKTKKTLEIVLDEMEKTK